VLLPKYLSDEAEVAAFITEIKRLSSLRHPNVVYSYGASNDGKRWMAVQEFCELKSLSDVLQAPAHRAKLTADLRKRMVLEAAKGLSFLHSRNIVHLDVKPLNFFVTEQYHIKIGDFGLAKGAAKPGGVQHSLPRGCTPL